MARISITKASAAQRQLDAAIRMFFGNEDHLAVFTVAAAANTVLVDLHRKRDPRKLGQATLRSFEKGILKAAKTGAFNETFPDLHDAVREGATIEISPDFMGHVERIFLKSPANFLKHADRDPLQSLDQSQVFVDLILMEAVANYLLLGLSPTPEMEALRLWSHIKVECPPFLVRAKPGGKLIAFGDLSISQKLKLGRYLVAEFRAIAQRTQ